MIERRVIGWDIGGAHVKACVLQRGEVIDVAQWACPLWQGIDQLAAVLRAAHERWPGIDTARHAVTMTGEMADLFEDREDGVRRIAGVLQRSLTAGAARAAAGGIAGSIHFYAGDAGWCDGADAAAARWQAVASANWLATAGHAALRFGDGVLIDIGSTTTDLIAFGQGRVLTTSRTDAQRLASGELVYHGVVRTPLCAFAPRIAWRGVTHNVMNELFATAADVYRLTGELDAAHDVHPSADSAAKDLPATRRRLARMIGLDARDGGPAEWLAFAAAWRAAQVAELGGQLRRVMALHHVGPATTVVTAGCGDFLVRDVLAHALADDSEAALAATLARYGHDVARVATHASGGRETVQAWAQVCAPCVAVATLFDEGLR
jgi:(4-(4-[2-(gamma-L-glutamylamino)ethyl]phenoxymethyl)furan-2-yl)methanamine synthase